MSYTVQQLAKLAGVSVRTLHHYDQIGLLEPARVKANGYRQYEEAELLKLQQIMFFRELDFPLEEIKRIVNSPSFDMSSALKDQRRLIKLKTRRYIRLMMTIDKTLKKLNNQKTMKDDELYGSFSNKETDQYAAEAKQRWGHTDAYKQSQERVKKMGKEGLKKVQKEGEELLLKIAAVMDNDPASSEVQKLIAQHYNNLRHFYEPNLEMYRGLGEMYVADERFKSYFEKVKPGLAVFMRDAMSAFCEQKK